MKEKDNLRIKVGLFIFFALFVMGSVVFILGSQRNIFSPQFSIFCDFDDISGLRAGAPVFLAGLNVGRVDAVLFSKDLNNKKLRIKLSINKDYQDRVRRDSIASIQGQGLLGDKSVMVSVGTATEPMVKDGDVLASEPPIDFTVFLQKGNKLLDTVNKAADNIQKMVEGMGDSKGDVKVMVHSLRNIFAEIESGQGLVHSLIYDRSSQQAIHNITEATADFKATADNLREMSEKIKRGEGSIGGLINDPTVYYDLKTLFGKANRNKLLKGIIRWTEQKQDERLIGGQKKESGKP